MPEDPTPNTPEHQVLAEEGVDRDEASALIPIIVEQCGVQRPGFWRYVQRNRDIVGIIARARDARISRGQSPAGTGVVKYGADVNVQPRTSERLSAGARKFVQAHEIAAELDAELGIIRHPDEATL